MVNTAKLKRQLVSNVTCHDDKFSHHSQKKNLLTIYHQNIGRLSNKINELIPFLHPDFLDVLCLTEHQLKQAPLELTYLESHLFHIPLISYRCGTSHVYI